MKFINNKILSFVLLLLIIVTGAVLAGSLSGDKELVSPSKTSEQPFFIEVDEKKSSTRRSALLVDLDPDINKEKDSSSEVYLPRPVEPSIIPGLRLPPQDTLSDCEPSFMSPPIAPSKLIIDPYGESTVINELIVDVIDNTSCQTVKGVISKVGGRIISFSPKPDTYLIGISTSTYEGLIETLKILKNDPNVLGVMTNTLMRMEIIN